MATCSVDDCSLDAYADRTECILHCEKEDYSADFIKAGFLRRFYDEIINYIVEFAFSYKDETREINKESLKEYLKHESSSEQQEIISFAKQLTTVFTKIVFPSRDNRDHFDYLPVLNKLGSIHFNYCEFNLHGLELDNVKCFYQDCLFHENWHIYNSPVLGNVNNVLYQHSVFYKDVGSNPEGGERYAIDASLFNNCEFKGRCEFYHVDFNAPIFNNTDERNTEINELIFSGCTFQKKLILNNCTIGSYLSENSVFDSKFEFKNNLVREFKLINTNHFKLVDTYKTKYSKFRIHKSIFEDFVGLENCEFGVEGDISGDYVATFMYATFLSFVNFRNTKFYGGLDLEHINLKEPPNFLNVAIESNNSNRETFRIIKYSFDRIGNSIEANKFFVREMRKYKEDLAGTKRYQEQFILFLNEKVSNFGQSYLKPIGWIAIAAIIYSLLIFGHEKNALYRMYLPANHILGMLSNMFNTAARNILPFSKILTTGMEFISLIFYIIFASLIWQVIVAVKRHTRR